MIVSEYKKTNEALEKLSEIEFEVTQNDATEPPFRNKFWDKPEFVSSFMSLSYAAGQERHAHEAFLQIQKHRLFSLKWFSFI